MKHAVAGTLGTQYRSCSPLKAGQCHETNGEGALVIAAMNGLQSPQGGAVP